MLQSFSPSLYSARERPSAESGVAVGKHGSWRWSVPAVIIGAGVVLLPLSSGAFSPPRPNEFEICQGCHGVGAQGNAELSAPRIAGLDSSYIGRQLTYFRGRQRGAGDQDEYGAQMVRIASMLDDEAIARLSAYISSMPEVPLLSPPVGDVTAGRSTYAVCGSCHGVNGEGGAALGAPRLAGMTDWYLERQFLAYKSGERGLGAGDEGGIAMQGIAKSIQGTALLRDVIAYAVSLPAAEKIATGCGSKGVGACGSSP